MTTQSKPYNFTIRPEGLPRPKSKTAGGLTEEQRHKIEMHQQRAQERQLNA